MGFSLEVWFIQDSGLYRILVYSGFGLWQISLWRFNIVFIFILQSNSMQVSQPYSDLISKWLSPAMKVKQHHSYIKLLVLSYWIYLWGGKKHSTHEKKNWNVFNTSEWAGCCYGKCYNTWLVHISKHVIFYLVHALRERPFYF